MLQSWHWDDVTTNKRGQAERIAGAVGRAVNVLDHVEQVIGNILSHKHTTIYITKPDTHQTDTLPEET